MLESSFILHKAITLHTLYNSFREINLETLNSGLFTDAIFGYALTIHCNCTLHITPYRFLS